MNQRSHIGHVFTHCRVVIQVVCSNSYLQTPQPMGFSKGSLRRVEICLAKQEKGPRHVVNVPRTFILYSPQEGRLAF